MLTRTKLILIGLLFFLSHAGVVFALKSEVNPVDTLKSRYSSEKRLKMLRSMRTRIERIREKLKKEHETSTEEPAIESEDLTEQPTSAPQIPPLVKPVKSTTPKTLEPKVTPAVKVSEIGFATNASPPKRAGIRERVRALWARHRAGKKEETAKLETTNRRKADIEEKRRQKTILKPKPERSVPPEEESQQEQIHEPKPEKVVPTEAEMLVTTFVFLGNSVIKTAYLQKMAHEYCNKMLTVTDLKVLCQDISAAYRKKGFFLARAYLPPQDVRGGGVIIMISEGRLGRVRVEGAKHYPENFVREHVRATRRGVLNSTRLVRSILLLNGYPDLNAAATLVKGEEAGTTDVVVQVKDEKKTHFSVNYNNFGAESTAKEKAGLTMQRGSLAQPGDLLSLQGIFGLSTNDVAYSRIDYSVPLNGRGQKLTLSYLESDFQVGGEFKILEVEGQSQIWSFGLLSPRIRKETTSLDLVFGFDYKKIENYLLGTVSSADELRVFRAGLNYDHLDRRRIRNLVAASVSQGLGGIMGGLEKDDPRSSRLGAGGQFTKLNVDFRQFRMFGKDSSCLARITAQAASDPLPVPEQFSIGGADTVRGFPPSEYLGDQGVVASVELLFPVQARLVGRGKVQLAGFVDHGLASLKNPQPGEDRSQEITGAGAGVQWTRPGRMSVRVDVGWPVSGDPSDGSDSTTYIQLMMAF